MEGPLGLREDQAIRSPQIKLWKVLLAYMRIKPSDHPDQVMEGPLGLREDQAIWSPQIKLWKVLSAYVRIRPSDHPL